MKQQSIPAFFFMVATIFVSQPIHCATKVVQQGKKYAIAMPTIAMRSKSVKLTKYHALFRSVVLGLGSEAPEKERTTALSLYKQLLQSGKQEIADALGMLGKRLARFLKSPLRFFRTRAAKRRKLDTLLDLVEVHINSHLSGQQRETFTRMRNALSIAVGETLTGPMGINWNKKKMFLAALTAAAAGGALDYRMRGKESLLGKATTSLTTKFPLLKQTLHNANKTMDTINTQFGDQGEATKALKTVNTQLGSEGALHGAIQRVNAQIDPKTGKTIKHSALADITHVAQNALDTVNNPPAQESALARSLSLGQSITQTANSLNNARTPVGGLVQALRPTIAASNAARKRFFSQIQRNADDTGYRKKMGTDGVMQYMNRDGEWVSEEDPVRSITRMVQGLNDVDSTAGGTLRALTPILRGEMRGRIPVPVLGNYDIQFQPNN